MGISETAYHPVGEQILRSGCHSFGKYRQFLCQVTMQVTVEEACKVGIVIHYHTTVTGTFRPNARMRIISVVGKFFQAPLADAGLVEYIIDIITAPFAVGVMSIIFEYHADIHYITRLHQIPIVMGDSVGYDIIRPFLESSGIDTHLIGIMNRQVPVQEVIKGNNIIKYIFMDYLKRTHTDQCLLVTVV